MIVLSGCVGSCSGQGGRIWSPPCTFHLCSPCLPALPLPCLPPVRGGACLPSSPPGSLSVLCCFPEARVDVIFVRRFFSMFFFLLRLFFPSVVLFSLPSFHLFFFCNIFLLIFFPLQYFPVLVFFHIFFFRCLFFLSYFSPAVSLPLRFFFPHRY